MQIELIIGSPVKAATHTNVYQLDLEWSHGDADGESQKTHFFKEDEVEKLKLFMAIQNELEDSDYLGEFATEWLEKHTKLSEDKIEELAEEFSDTFYDGDHTCDYSRGAELSDVRLVYWDEHGIKFDVTWKVTK